MSVVVRMEMPNVCITENGYCGYHNGKWYWFSTTCKDYLDEYGRCEVDEVDKDIDILYWMPLPSPPVNKMFTK